MTSVPGTAIAAPSVFVMRSWAMGAFTATPAVALLLAPEGSAVSLLTDAVFMMGSGPVYNDGTAQVAAMVLVSPGASVGNVHGNTVVQSPLLETKASPTGGAGSSTR